MEDEEIQCEKCDFKSACLQALISHYCRKHKICTDCGKTFIMFEDFYSHMHLIHGQTVHCDLCEFQAYPELELNYHKLTEHGICSKEIHSGPCSSSLKKEPIEEENTDEHPELEYQPDPILKCQFLHCPFEGQSLDDLLAHREQEHPVQVENHEQSAFRSMEDKLQVVTQGLSKDSCAKYMRYWNEFVKFTGIEKTGDTPPTEAMFVRYFEMKQKAGVSAKSVASIYSCLNSIHNELYNFKLQKWTFLTDFIKNIREGQPSHVQRTVIITKDQLNQFLTGADNGDRYLLVRKVMAIFIIFSGQGYKDLRHFRLTDVEILPQGIAVKQPYFSSNQSETFLIPFKDPLVDADSEDPCYASIVQLYLDALKTDLQHVWNEKMTANALFFMGTKGMDSKFTWQPIGHNTIAKTGEKIAEWLQLPEPEKYNIRCFREIAGSCKGVKRPASFPRNSVAKIVKTELQEDAE